MLKGHSCKFYSRRDFHEILASPFIPNHNWNFLEHSTSDRQNPKPHALFVWDLFQLALRAQKCTGRGCFVFTPHNKWWNLVLTPQRSTGSFLSCRGPNARRVEFGIFSERQGVLCRNNPVTRAIGSLLPYRQPYFMPFPEPRSMNQDFSCAPCVWFSEYKKAKFFPAVCPFSTKFHLQFPL